MPAPFPLRVLQRLDLTRLKEHVCPVLLPHEVFAALYGKYIGHFRKTVCSGTDAIRKFWSEQVGNPMYQGHPI
eukprot:12711770-Alexandrium_andersonii.AAC.1